MLEGNGRSGNPTNLAIPGVEAPWTRLLQHQGDGKVALDQSHARSGSLSADVARKRRLHSIQGSRRRLASQPYGL